MTLVKPNIFKVIDTKPVNFARQEKPGATSWIGVKTPHLVTLGQSMPMGLLLALTYNTSIVVTQ